MSTKIPLTAEVISDTGEGKTHFALACFPDPCLVETQDTPEGLLVLKRLFPEDWKSRRIVVDKYEDFKNAIAAPFKTVVIDLSKDLQTIGIEKWTEDKNRVKPRNYEYGEVREYGRDVIRKVVASGKNIVFCTQMKDEYGALPDGSSGKTGRKEADSFAPVPNTVRLRIYIKRDDPEDMELKGKGIKTRKLKVIKNGSRDSADPADWVNFISGLTPGLTPEQKTANWKVIKDLMKLGNEEAVE